MAKRYYTSIDLRYNELLKAAFENIDTTAILADSTKAGRVFFATDLKSPVFFDGTAYRTILWDGASINPRTISQVGDATEAILLVSQEQVDQWTNGVNDSTLFEHVAMKNAAGGYAGLDASAKLALSVLWDGMVIEDASNPGTYLTLGDLLDQPLGLPTLNVSGLLDATKVEQTADYQFVSLDDKTRWNTTVIDATGYEQQANKGAGGGYAPLNDSTRLPNEYLTEGVIVRRQQRNVYLFSGSVNAGDEFYYSFNGGTSRQLTVVTPTISWVTSQLAATVNGLMPEAGFITADATNDTLGVTGIQNGYSFTFSLSYVPAGSPVCVLTLDSSQPPWYDLVSWGGVANGGYPPLNSMGLVDDQYLPNYRDMAIVQDIAERDALVSGGQVFNAMRVHVIDATADPTVETGGWAEYLWDATGIQWLKVGEEESTIDIRHNITKEMQGDGVNMDPVQAYHLTAEQLDKLKYQHTRYLLPGVDTSGFPGYVAHEFDATTWRGASYEIIYEDSTNKSVMMWNAMVLFDGNRAIYNEYGAIRGAYENPIPAVTVDYDSINKKVQLLIGSGGSSANLTINAQLFPLFDSFDVALVPMDELYPSNGLDPDIYTGPLPSTLLTPAADLEPEDPKL